MSNKQESIQLSSLALIILSSISLIFIITTNPKPVTVYLDKSFEYKIGEKYKIFTPGSSECLVKCSFMSSGNNVKNFADDINKIGLEEVRVTSLNDQVYITHLKGRHVILEYLDTPILSTVTDTPIKFLKNYFFGILMALISFSMVFYLVRDVFFNSGKKLGLKAEEIQKNLDVKLEKIQEMDKHIYVESLHNLTVSDKDILEKFEDSNPDEILILSKELESDINNYELQVQVIKNLKKGVSYTWILSEKYKNPPIIKLLKSLYNLDSEVENHLGCIAFYSLNDSKLMLLPYELNFYIYSNNKNPKIDGGSHTPTKLIAFEKKNNINLSNCVSVGEILGTIEDWKEGCQETAKAYFDNCSNGRVKISISKSVKDNSKSVPIFSEKE